MPRHGISHESPTQVLPHVLSDETRLAPGTIGASAFLYMEAAKQRTGLVDLESIGGVALGDHIEHEANKDYDQVKRTVEMVRAKIIVGEDNEAADAYLGKLMGGEYNQARLAGSTHPNISSWMADYSHGASDTQVYNFITRHINEVRSSQQQPEVQAAIADVKAQYIAGIYQGNKQGALSDYAIDTLDKVHDTKVLVGDVWDTAVMGMTGYYLPGTEYIIMAQEPTTKGQIDRVHKTLPHEMEHLQNLELDEGLPRWLYEARAEHWQLAISHGEWNVITPEARTYDSGVYSADRTLLGVIAESLGSEGSGLITRALSSPSGSPEWEALDVATTKLYGPRFLDRVTERAEAIEQAIIRNKNPVVSPRSSALIAISEQIKQGRF